MIHRRPRRTNARRRAGRTRRTPRPVRPRSRGTAERSCAPAPVARGRGLERSRHGGVHLRVGPPCRCARVCAAGGFLGRSARALHLRLVTESSGDGEISCGGVPLPDRGYEVGFIHLRVCGRPDRGCGSPPSVQAAWMAAPSATYSPVGGTATGWPSIDGAICRSASDRAPPPTKRMRFDTGTVAFQGVESVCKSAQQALDRGPGEVRRSAGAQVNPCTAPVASGRLGVRSPSR